MIHFIESFKGVVLLLPSIKVFFLLLSQIKRHAIDSNTVLTKLLTRRPVLEGLFGTHLRTSVAGQEK